MSEALREHALVTGPIELSRLNLAPIYAWQGITEWGHLPRWLDFLPQAFGCNLAARREVFDKTGGFRDLSTGQDLDFVWRAQLAGFPLSFAPDSLVHRRIPASFLDYSRRQFWYAKGEPLLFRNFSDDGMPRSSTLRALAKALLVGAATPLILHPRYRYLWANAASTRLGRLLGSLEHRALYL